MQRLILVMIGGAFGAAARYGIGEMTRAFAGKFPYGTFIVNVTGSFVIGLCLTLTGLSVEMQEDIRLAVVVGFVGAYTTFSAFEFETFKLIADGHFALAAANVLLSLAVGFIAVWLGVSAGRWISHPN